ncbi:MAG: A/G-specific adenine glycosylase [Woeseiaceae bacterium]|nr:A/G-specific adenine glycosylase [Woeseiaceae bacterium]
MNAFARRLLDWFDAHGRRDLPWQQDITPYRVWVSEIMLQQTQVTTVIPYFNRFVSAFPQVSALADASLDDVLHLWSGLGYYARGRNLHRTARILRDDFGGEFPTAFDDVVALPGIGRSTAGAILAIACGQRHPILDGNVKRVLARYHAIEGWPGRAATQKALWNAAEVLTPAERVADYTQAIMDLGATVCTRSRPACGCCPFAADCVAHRQGNETAYPGRKPKKARPLKATVMPLVHTGDRLYLEKRAGAGIWGGLWSLPEIDAAGALDDWLDATFERQAVSVTSWPVLRHSFSHYDLDIQPVEVRLANASRKVADGESARWFSLDDSPGVGLAAPVKTLIGRLTERGRDE